jgi:hypothetical protein
MKKSDPTESIAPFSKAAFRIGAESLRGQRLDLLLDETLATIFGGNATDPDPGACSEFSCNLFSPPPPPKAGTDDPESPTTSTKKEVPPKAPA